MLLTQKLCDLRLFRVPLAFRRNLNTTPAFLAAPDPSQSPRAGPRGGLNIYHPLSGNRDARYAYLHRNMSSNAFSLQNIYDLTDRIAVVTGGGTGIGWMIARGLATNGAKGTCLAVS